ncbi:TRAP transporter small permease [Ruegeria sediminis]|nr:TRAP transporter small permease [Ruegeria sediminis]
MLRFILNGVTLAESITATIAYAFVAVLLMVDVIGREVFSSALLGIQQLAVYGAIVAGFLGLTLATSDNSHLRPAFLDFLAGRHQREVARIGDALSAIFFFGAGYVAWTFVQISMENGDRAPVLYFVLWPLQLVVPYAFGSAGLKHLIFALRPDLKSNVDKLAG